MERRKPVERAPRGMDLAPIKSTRIYEEIVRQIKTMIAEGRLKSGDQLPPERDLVFERFTRLPSPASSRTRETGSGLGLAIVRDIAVAHGGHVTVEAADPGSRFVLELPAG